MSRFLKCKPGDKVLCIKDQTPFAKGEIHIIKLHKSLNLCVVSSGNIDKENGQLPLADRWKILPRFKLRRKLFSEKKP